MFESGLAFSPDGKILAAVVRPITIQLWDVVARKKLRDIQGHDFQVRHVAFTSDGKRLYAADGNGVSVWDSATGKPLDDWGQHRYAIFSAAWSPDGKRIASAASYTDKIGRVWDPSTGRKVFELVGHKFGIKRVAYSPDGSLLATSSQDGTVKLWNSASGKELHSFETKDGTGWALAFSPDGRFLVTGGLKALHVWDVAGRKEARVIPHSGDPPLRIEFLPGGQRALVQDYKVGTRIIDFTSGREEEMHAEVKKWSLALAISPDGRYVAHADEKGAILLADAMTGHEVQVLIRAVLKKTDFQEVMGLAYSPDGRTIAAAYRLGDRPSPDVRADEVRVYEVATGSERFRFSGHVNDAVGVCFSPDGSRLCSFGGDKTLIDWDVTGGRRASAPPPKDLDAAWTALASPDAAKAFAAIRYMADKPAAVRLLAERIKPVSAADRKAVVTLVEKLGSPEFPERESASKELTKLASGAIDQLREANRRTTSQEVRTRLSAILAVTRGTLLTGEKLRSARAVEALELAATADARELLTRLAKGAEDAHLTQETKRSLERLRR
jgi:WD40 repeat protein